MATSQTVNKSRVALKSIALLFVLTVLTSTCFALSNDDFRNYLGFIPSWMDGFPYVGFGFGFLQVLIVVFLFDFYLKSESEERFHTMLMSAPFIRDNLKDEKIMELLEAGFWRIVKDDDFARDLVGIIKNAAVLPERRVYGLSADITLMNSSEAANKAFFKAKWDISFTEKSAKRVFKFAVAQSNAEYNGLRADKSIEWRWLQPKHSKVPQPSGDLIKVTHFSLDGEEIKRKTTGEANRVIFNTPRKKIGKDVRVRYVLELYCRRTSHLIFYSFDYPTKGYDISIDYSQAGVDFMNIVDSLTTPTAPTITYSPNNRDPYKSHRIKISDPNEWIIPKSSIAFVWRLKE